jgi:hypothetical protein
MFVIRDQSFYLDLESCFSEFDAVPEKCTSKIECTISEKKLRNEKIFSHWLFGGCFNKLKRQTPPNSKHSISQSCSDDAKRNLDVHRNNSMSRSCLIKPSNCKAENFQSIQEVLSDRSSTSQTKLKLEEQNRLIEDIKRLYLKTFQIYMAKYFKFLRLIFVSGTEDPKPNFKMLGLTKKFVMDFVKQPLEPKIKHQVFKIYSIWTESITPTSFGIQSLNIE